MESLLCPWWKHNASWELRLLKQTTLQVLRLRSTEFMTGQLSLLAERVTPISILWFPDLWILGMREISTLFIDWECRPHPAERYPSSARCCHPFGAATNYSSCHFPILSDKLLQGDGKHGKTNEFHEHEPIACHTSFAINEFPVEKQCWVQCPDGEWSIL